MSTLQHKQLTFNKNITLANDGATFLQIAVLF